MEVRSEVSSARADSSLIVTSSLSSTPGPERSRGWRNLPLTGQLLAIGIIVSLAWFLTARLATDRREAAALERFATLTDLRRAEVAAGRLGTSLLSISRAYRGYLITGGGELLQEVEDERVVFAAALAQLADLSARPVVVRETVLLRAALQFWIDSAYAPSVRLRTSAGLRAFDSGSAGAAFFLRGADLMSSALELQAAAARDLRRAIDAAALDLERAADEQAWEAFLITIGAFAIFVLVLLFILRYVGRALEQVVRAVQALGAGRYREARFPDAAMAPNRETAELAASFEQLAASIEQRELQLQSDIVKLTELDRLKRDFVSTVSHELRTPLTSMRGALGLILGGKVGEVPAKGRELLQIAMLNTERLIRLTNDILDVEKIDAGEIDVRRDRLHLRPLVLTTIVGLESFAREHHVGVTLTAPPEVDAEIIGDADRVVQVLTNLLSNAVKYAPVGTSVEIGMHAEGATVSVSVRDHGPGISPEFAGRIFGRFQQAADPALHRSGGTGLGLSIAKSIVEKHEGAIGFDPAEGGGTLFWVRFPVAAPLDRVADPRAAILIVEDDPSMRDVLVAQFDAIARTIAVQSAEAALAVLEHEEVAAIILDPGLPGMDGLTFAQRVRKNERTRRMPMFLYSAREYAADELRTAGIRSADAFVKSRDAESDLFDRLSHELQKQAAPSHALEQLRR